MMFRMLVIGLGVALALSGALPANAPNSAPDAGRFNPIDIFQLEYASDPRIAPGGGSVVYVRNFMDIMSDRRRSNLWIVNTDGTATGSSNHALIGPIQGPTLRDGSLNPLMAGPLGARIVGATVGEHDAAIVSAPCAHRTRRMRGP